MASDRTRVCLLVCFMVVVPSAFSFGDYDPQQIHISTANYSDMTIVWNTFKDTPDSIVMYHKNTTTDFKQATGKSTKFVDGGSEKRVQYIHSVTLTGLEASTTYNYKVGSKKYNFSKVLTFKIWPAGQAWSPRLAVYGDLGAVNGQSLGRLTKDVESGMYDGILHVGDMAYNLDTDNARWGDKFMNQIQPIASRVPYMVTPGNHENYYNFSNYKARFQMPGDINKRMYYSFKMGPMRVISTCTEYIFYPKYGLMAAFEHYKWLEDELRDANLPENRAKQPWVVTIGHRPMYCSNRDSDDCTHNESIIRTGLFGVMAWEKLFHQYGVDVAIWAHEHSYERLWPIYNRKVMNGSVEEPYTNPKAPVHVITGSAGCYSKHDPFKKAKPDWSAFRSSDYGYTRMNVINSTHLYMEQVSDDKGGKVIDSFTVIKDSHGPYKYDPTPIRPVGDQRKMYDKYQKYFKAAGIHLP